MKISHRLGLLLAGILTALASSASAQILQLNATLNAAQETDGSTSTATGTAVMLYNVATNTYTLTLTLNNFANPITASSLREGARTVAGASVAAYGADSGYTRSGSTVTGALYAQTYGGTPLTLIQNGAYLEFNSAAWPNGEIRGQLVAQPIKLYANINSAQETAPATGVSKAFGGAYINYDPGTNVINTRISLYNYTNTLTLSHYHESPVGIAGGVVLTLGAAAAYVKNGNNFNQVFVNQTYSGHPLVLLTGGAYVNFHSNVFGGGEIRGQVYVSSESPSSRLVNMSALGTVNPNESPLITGFVVTGAEPIVVLLDVRGPSLAGFGLSTALSDPQLTVWSGSGTMIASNTGVGSAFDVTTLTSKLYMPLLAAEPAQLLVVPPGAYAVQATSATGKTGTVLIEGFDAR